MMRYGFGLLILHLRWVTIPVMVAAFSAAFHSRAMASQGDPDLCRDAARSAAAETGVPFDVLMAISLTETGRERGGRLEPWPWAIHHGGQGYWFDTKAEAVAMAETALQAGATNIDLGCFQLNIRWHAGAFVSAEDMLAPDRNARYAAEFLADLYKESGDWTLAAGAYHSRTPENAQSYRAKFETILVGLQGGQPVSDTRAFDPVLSPRDNLFPLLQTGAPGGIGSLVPLLEANAPLVGG
jgi:Transglycosylase SLT domain